MRKKLLGVLTASLFALSPIAAAEVQINGFASVVSGIDLEDDGQSAYGSRTVDNLQESKVALQWTADIEKGLRFVGQTMARGDASTGFTMNYDWAYFDFNVGDAGKLKVGRLRIPFYKYSDYLDVGYAYHWITPPASMYSLSFSNIDGAGYQQNYEMMGMDQSINVVIGAYQGDLSVGGNPTASSLENFLAINWAASIGDHEFYAAYAQADVYIPAAAVAGLAALAADADDVLINGDYGHFFGLGYKGQFGDLAVYAEYSQVGIDDSILSDTAGGYIGASYNMGEYTYHVTFETSKADEKSYTGGNSGTDIGLATTIGAAQASAVATATLNQTDPVAAATAAATAVVTVETITPGTYSSGSDLNSTSRSLGNGDSSTITFGVRKDIGASTALKLDLSLYTEDRVQTDQITAVSEEMKATTLKFAIETMF